jgi:hypothetical protein
LEVPATTLLQKFEPVAMKMVRCGMAILNHTENDLHSNISFCLHFSGSTFAWTPPKVSSGQEYTPMIRFPQDCELLEIVRVFLTRNVPGEFWFRDGVLNIQRDAGLIAKLKGARLHVVENISNKWRTIARLKTNEKLAQFKDDLFWMLEDFCLAERLLLNQGNRTSFDFPQTLTICGPDWERLLCVEELHPELEHATLEVPESSTVHCLIDVQ